MKLFDPPEPSPPGLNGAGGGVALLNAAIRSLNEPPLGFSDTGGGAEGFEAGIGLAAVAGGGKNSVCFGTGELTAWGLSVAGGGSRATGASWTSSCSGSGSGS